MTPEQASTARRRCVAGLALLPLLAAAGQAGAAGFALMEQSGRGMGNAFAGGAAAAEDASTIFFNPAGLMRLEGAQVVGAGHLILPSAEFRDGGSTDALGAPMRGGDGGDAAEPAFLPNLYFTLPMTESLRFGFGLNAPFGLMTKYEPDWRGRYHATKSDLRTINLNPSLAFDVTERLSLGVGVNVQRAQANLQSAVDFGTVCLGLPPIAPCAGAAPQGADGLVKIEGSSWGYGYNLGALWRPTDQLRLGAHFRSKVDHDLRGRVDFSGRLEGVGPFVDGAAQAKLTTPETASLSAWYDFSARWAVMADVTWTNWSRFEALEVRRSPGGALVSSVPQNYRDSWRYALGVTHRLGERWTLRGGLAYDQTPVQDAFRSARVPDQDRVWLAAGVGWSPWAGASVDLAYAHLFIEDAPVDVSLPAPVGRLRGEYEGSVDLLSVQLTHSF